MLSARSGAHYAFGIEKLTPISGHTLTGAGHLQHIYSTSTCSVPDSMVSP